MTFKNLRNNETIDVDYETRSLAYSNHLMEQKKKCKTSYKLELWKRIKVTDCEVFIRKKEDGVLY